MTESLRDDHTGAAAGAIDAALGGLDLDAKARLLAGRSMWSLPALPDIGLAPIVMSDGPVGVRGVRWTADDPSVALPSPTALAATWDPDLARRAGRLLAQEARRKGVRVLLAPTVNLQRSPLGGRHFECFSEDPFLTAEIGTGYVLGVQDGGVAATVKHFVANDAETERFTVNNTVAPRPLRELYLAPFEAIVRDARPWAVMAAYNAVNGRTMTEHAPLQRDVLRGAWGFDGVTVSDWFAARDTVGALTGGLDVAMPGPATVYGEALAAAVRDGRMPESLVDAAVRNVLLLAARTGALAGAPPAVAPEDLPPHVDGRELAREIACRSFVLLRNQRLDHDRRPGGEGRPGGARRPGGHGRRALPLDPAALRRVAVLGSAARDARVLGGGSALVFPASVVSPLDGLRAALPDHVELTYAVGADPGEELGVAEAGWDLRAVVRAADGRRLGEERLPSGMVLWTGDLPAGVAFNELHTVEITGTFTPRESGAHTFGTRGLGHFRLTVAGTLLHEGHEAPAGEGDPFEAFLGTPRPRGALELAAGEPVAVSLVHTPPKDLGVPLDVVACALLHGGPERDPEDLLREAARAAADADTAVVVVATTERVESEGFDRTSLALPGRQDDLVRRVAAANPHTVVVVNSGSPVEMPWRDDVPAVLLSWFPGQEAGAALADVLLGAAEPGGRLPTTWPATLADAPVTDVTPVDGALPYGEGLFIGYRAWERAGRAPAYWFGHGLGYTDWAYEAIDVLPGGGEGDTERVVRVRVRNTGARAGREVIQIYLAPRHGGGGAVLPERPARWLAGFASVTAGPGETAEADVPLRRRAFEVWDEDAGAWVRVPGPYAVQVGGVSEICATSTLTLPVT
ncbi:glycoside hydrolase family 3 protein [Streptomyces sp. URMC 123]|uniref:glycoside hydrolase family 3 protein n=1 Tax=Streptomyces sp. URMC 123 TaxID=3423403 RepID=UPI003F1E2DCC